MSIEIITGLPGSGKTSRLIEAVNAAVSDGKPVLTFACSDSPRLREHQMIGVQNLIASRNPALKCRLNHFVSIEDCRSILERTPAGTLAVFEEAQAFGSAIVPAWIDASHRGVDLLIALPNSSGLQLNNGHGVTETALEMACQKCAQLNASTFFLLPNDKETVSVCDDCAVKMTQEARQEILRLLDEETDYLGKKELYQPIEQLEELSQWKIVRPDSAKRAKIMARVIRESGLPDSGPVGRSTYLDVGCNTGYFCHFTRRLGFYAEGIDVAEREIKVAKLLDCFFRKDFNQYRVANAHDYLKSTADRRFDITSAFSVFQWLLIQSPERALECLEWLFAKTKRICFLEMGYASEKHYQGRLPDNIDRSWVLDLMDRKGGFSEIRVLDARQHDLQRDLFIGLKSENI